MFIARMSFDDIHISFGFNVYSKTQKTSFACGKFHVSFFIFHIFGSYWKYLCENSNFTSLRSGLFVKLNRDYYFISSVYHVLHVCDVWCTMFMHWANIFRPTDVKVEETVFIIHHICTKSFYWLVRFGFAFVHYILASLTKQNSSRLWLCSAMTTMPCIGWMKFSIR